MLTKNNSSAKTEGAGSVTVDEVKQQIQQQPHLFMRLAVNSLTVATSLRDNYFQNTASFIRHLKLAMAENRQQPILRIEKLYSDWQDYQGESVCFIDGGTGSAHIASQIPILLRVGSYTVKVGEAQLAEREQFGYYPIILGDIEGGSKERKDFIDIVRITAELLGGLAALDRNPNLHTLFFHGPLVYQVSHYAGHTPFTKNDLHLFLQQYAGNLGKSLQDEFYALARQSIYPALIPDRARTWSNAEVVEPLSWIAFLLRKLIQLAKSRQPVPIIAGIIERGFMTDFIRQVLFQRVFNGLRAKQREDHFNHIFGRNDLDSPDSLIRNLGYTDGLLLSMLLAPAEQSEPWLIDSKYQGFRRTEVRLPGESFAAVVDFTQLNGTDFGFPAVKGSYVQVATTREPVRVEVFSELGDEQVTEAARRAYLYSRLLPDYCFPVGLEIADRYAHVPKWMTQAFDKLIRFHLSESLQKGEISDDQMRRILVQAIYMKNRDWLFRPI